VSWLRRLVTHCTQRGREFNTGPVHIGGRRSTGMGFSVSLSVLTRKYHPVSVQYSRSYYDSSERQVGQGCERENIVNTLSDIGAASVRRGFSSF